MASAVVPVGWQPLVETLEKIAGRNVQIYACGACSRARGISEADLNQWGAKFGNPTIFVSLWNGQIGSLLNSKEDSMATRRRFFQWCGAATTAFWAEKHS